MTGYVLRRTKEHPHIWGARWGVFNSPQPSPGIFPHWPLWGGEGYFYSYAEAANFIRMEVDSEVDRLLILPTPENEPVEPISLRIDIPSTDNRYCLIAIWKD